MEHPHDSNSNSNSNSISLEDRPWLAAYAEGVPPDIAPVTETLVDMLEASVSRFDAHVALEFFGARTTYADLGAQVERAAGGLRKLGVSKGDRVALVLPNCPQHVVAFYAVLRLGAIVVEHNPLYTARELRHQFDVHGATVAIVWDKVADVVAGLPADVVPAHVISVRMTDAMPWMKRVALRLPVAKARTAREALTATPQAAGVVTWTKIVDSRPLAARTPRPSLDDIALLQLTSGTSGIPKAAILSHRNLRSNAAQGRAWVPGLNEGNEVFAAVLPLFHAYGLTLCLTFALSIGARVVLFPKFDVGLMRDAARLTPPTFLPAVPPIYDALARSDVDLRSIRYSISGAMSLPVPTVTRWEEKTGGLLVEGYGMTETSPVALGNPIGPSRRPGTVGVPFPSTEIRVVDHENPTVDRALGEAGELLIRGPQVFQGYWNRPEDTATALLPGGWLRTGDIVTVSEDGFVTVVDRVKEIIITGGFNVSPTEVEQVLALHPDIAAAAVVGIPRSSGGEKIVAAVTLAPGAVFDENAVREFARAHLTAYKVPREVVVVDELPRSQIGKVLRRVVRENLQGTPPG